MSRTQRRKKYIEPDVYYEYDHYKCGFVRWQTKLSDGTVEKKWITHWQTRIIWLKDEVLKQALSKYHREGRYNYRPQPPWWHRNETQRRERKHGKRELFRYVKNNDYEPLCYNKKPLPYWD